MIRSVRSVRLRFACGAVASVLALALAAVPALGNEVDFFDDGASNEALLSEMALHPASVQIGTRTFIAYQGVGYDPYVAAYDAADGTWEGPYRAGLNTLSLDTHGAPSLYVDQAGRLHVVYGGHNTRLYHSRTAEPGDISQWEVLPSIDPVGTYPQTFETSAGTIALLYRTTSYDWVLRFSDSTGTTFGEAETVLLGGPDTWWYADFRPGSGGRIHAAFVWNDYYSRLIGEPFARHHVYYMVREADGVWRDDEGYALPVPLDRVAADALVRVLDTGDTLVNEISVKEDQTGAPCVLYLTGEGSGEDAYEWRFMRRSGGVWDSSAITTADHFFDSGAIQLGTGGAVEALLVTGVSDAEGGENGNYRGRGGVIVRWSSSDHGATWSREETITPDEPATYFGDPQWVVGGSGDARAVFVEWTNDRTNFFNRMYLWGDSGLVMRDQQLDVTRLAGARRAQTAVAVSRKSFPRGARTVVIATESDFPDALAGVPLAHALDAPLLLTGRNGLSSAAIEEIVRLGAKKAVVLGGAYAVGLGVEHDLYGPAGITSMERIAGANRYETALSISRRLKLEDPTLDVDTAFVVSGENWPDATVAAPLAATARAPIVLSRATTLPVASASILEEWDAEHTVVIGGERVVGAAVFDALPSAYRVAGIDRYATAAAAATYGLETTLLPYRVVLATGENFPDALTGGGLAARLKSPVVLMRRSSVPTSALGYLDGISDKIVDVYAIGEEDVIGPEVIDQVSGLID